MYSQWNEEKYITEFFNNFIGRFLDIGAYNGVTFSNTYKLVKMGWGGVCIEPSISVLPSLKEIHKDNDKIEIIEVAIGQYDGSIKFYDSNGDAVSSCNKDHKIKWETNAKSKFKEIEVDCLSVNSLFNKVGYDFDFINIDVEGDSVKVFSQLPFSKLNKLKLICVEYDNSFNEALKIGLNNGFKEISREHGNLILGKS